MAIKTVPIDEASDEQLLAFTRDFLQLDPVPATAEEARSAIGRAQPGVVHIFCEVPDAAAPAASTSPSPNFNDRDDPVPLKPEEGHGRLQGTLGKSDPRAVIEIQVIETDDGKGGEDVFVGVNGRGWQLKRGVPLDVPWRVVLALDNAEQNIVRHRQDEGREGEVVTRQAKRFPYIFHSRPSGEEVKAWHEKIDAEFCA